MTKRLILGLILCAGSALQAEPVKLFDGQSLAGWKTKGAEVWSAKDGILSGSSNPAKQGSILWTENTYKDFMLTLDFRFQGRIDSGVFLRHENDQIQIGISGSLKRDMTASPYIASQRGYPVEAKNVAEILKEGEWNTMRITAKGKSYTVELNGREVMTYESETARAEGPVGLQMHAGVEMKIDFREITLSSL